MRHSHWFLPPPLRRLEIVGDVERVREVPERLPALGAVLVHGLQLNWIVFDCPCRTRHRIVLPLAEDEWPHWQLTTLVPVTISPSVDSIRPERRCHYWVRRGRIVWVPEPKNRTPRV